MPPPTSSAGGQPADRDQRLPLPSTNTRSSLFSHPEREQGHVLPAAVQHQAEETKIAIAGGLIERVKRIQVQQAVDVERREARLVLVEGRLGGLDPERIALARA